MLPLLLMVLILNAPDGTTQAHADFSRFMNVVNQEISIIDIDGTVREGILTAATEDEVTVRFGSGTKSFSRAAVVSAERTHDRVTDGVIKGALFGALMGALMSQAYDGSDRAASFVGHVAVYTGIGWMLDADNTNREPIYRAPVPSKAAATPKPGLSLAFRF
jgi:hypothetical protein